MLTGVADLENDFMRSPQWGGGGERGEGEGGGKGGGLLP